MMAYHPERVIHHPALTLKYFRPSRRPGLRVAVGVKTSPKATQRNLLRRRLREIWRAISIPQDVAATLYTTKVTLDLPFAELKRVVVQLTNQLTKE